MRLSTALPILIALGVFVLPDMAAAQLVQCDGPNCDFCSVVSTANYVINWLIGILLVLAAFLVAIAGVYLVISGGDSGALDRAKKMLSNALVGFIIVLAAWLVVDTIMKSMLRGQGQILGQPWNVVTCPAQPKLSENTIATTLPSGSGSTATGCAEGSCVQLSAACKNPNSCQVSSDIVENINSFHEAVVAAGITGARVTEAMPKTREHQASCHSNGTCIDYGKAGGMTGDEIAKVVQAARANNLRPVYEVGSQSAKDFLVRQGAPEDAILVLPPINGRAQITAPHFSIYAN